MIYVLYNELYVNNCVWYSFYIWRPIESRPQNYGYDITWKKHNRGRRERGPRSLKSKGP